MEWNCKESAKYNEEIEQSQSGPGRVALFKSLIQKAIAGDAAAMEVILYYKLGPPGASGSKTIDSLPEVPDDMRRDIAILDRRRQLGTLWPR